jgi:integrase/recombinase XerD
MKILEHLQEFERYLKKQQYADNTVKNYLKTFELFLVEHRSKAIPEDITKEEITTFLHSKPNPNTQSTFFMPIKVFYRNLTEQPEKVEGISVASRGKRKIPEIIDRQFLLRQINDTVNIKHKTMLSTIYSAGLRTGQLIGLLIEDVNSEKLTLVVRDTKGRPYKSVDISPKVAALCKEYIRLYTPTKHLFNGVSNRQYSPRSLGSVVKKCIGEEYTVEMIRNSTVAFLLENGTDMKLIQSHLGHAEMKTTRRHLKASVHIPAKLKLPL